MHLSTPQTVSECVAILTEMIEEAQREAEHCTARRDHEILIAKRDALTEAKLRIRDGRGNHRWALAGVPVRAQGTTG